MATRLWLGSRILVGLCLALILAGCGGDLGLDQHGRKVPAERVDGQWLIINYWAQWCTPCRTEIPELNGLDAQLKAHGATVLGVNFDGLQGEELAEASKEMGIAFTVLAQDPAQRFELPRSEALPVTYIVDDKGRLRERLLGEQTASGLTARLAALRKEE